MTGIAQMVSWGQHNFPMDFSLSAHGVPIYYLPGHGGRVTTGLGQALVSRGYAVVGRETVGDFKRLDFRKCHYFCMLAWVASYCDTTRRASTAKRVCVFIT